MINVSRAFLRRHAWLCEVSAVRFIMRIRQVIVTVFEKSSFIKRAIHLPAVKNKTGTLIYCRLPETWSFSSLYENQGVCLNNREEIARTDALWKRLNISALKSTTETREWYGLPLHYCDVFYMWHVVLAEITECFSPLQRSIKSLWFIPRGSGI